MAGFLYYVPRTLYTGTLKLERLRELGLAYAFDLDAPMVLGCERGPDGNGGSVCSPVATDHLGYYPEKQTWRKVVGNPHGVWVGMYTDEKRPKPEDLARKRQLGGVPTKLEDDNYWLLPIVRRWKENGSEIQYSHNLPSRFTLNEDGVWVSGGILPRYERLWQLMTMYQDHLFARNNDDNAKAIVVDTDIISDLFIECLKANYRVSHAEVDLLGIYDLHAFTSCVDALFDEKTLKELQKKRQLQPDGSTS